MLKFIASAVFSPLSFFLVIFQLILPYICLTFPLGIAHTFHNQVSSNTTPVFRAPPPVLGNTLQFGWLH